MASKKLVSSQIAKGSEIAVWARASPIGGVGSPTEVIMATSGMPMATGGTIRVTRVEKMKTCPRGLESRDRVRGRHGEDDGEQRC